MKVEFLEINNMRRKHINPCYQCLCVPICKSKDWHDCINNCSLLNNFFETYLEDSRFSQFNDALNSLRYKEFFQLDYLEGEKIGRKWYDR